MEVEIYRIDKTIPLPEYKTHGAVAMDCCARTRVSIPALTTAYIPLNFALKLPPGHFALMAPRSSLHKRGLLLPNSIGIFDEDFSSDEDEFHAAVYNFTNTPVEIEKGERITQIIILPYDKVSWKEVDSIGKNRRGGFGSTGL